MVVGKVVAHLCPTLIIWKKKLTMIKGEGHGSGEGGGAFMSNTNYTKKEIDNDKWRKDMVVGKVAALLCLNTNYQRIEI